MFIVPDIAVVGFTLLFSVFFENALHKASHYKQSGQLYKWHKLHHKDYNVKRLETDIYKDSTRWLDNMYAFYLILSQGIIYIASSNRVFAIFYIQTTVYALLLEYIHQQFHLKQCYWLRYKWFQILKKKSFTTSYKSK